MVNQACLESNTPPIDVRLRNLVKFLQALDKDVVLEPFSRSELIEKAQVFLKRLESEDAPVWYELGRWEKTWDALLQRIPDDDRFDDYQDQILRGGIHLWEVLNLPWDSEY